MSSLCVAVIQKYKEKVQRRSQSGRSIASAYQLLSHWDGKAGSGAYNSALDFRQFKASTRLLENCVTTYWVHGAKNDYLNYHPGSRDFITTYTLNRSRVILIIPVNAAPALDTLRTATLSHTPT